MSTSITCCKCGIEFWVPDHWHTKRKEDHEWFYCPNGHQQHFVGETEAERLRRERDRLQQRIAERDDEIKSLEGRRRAALGQVTKLRNRVRNGVCPCCSRSFTNLRQHMETKHPDWKAEAAE